MENIRFAIAAGETKTFERGGRYLEIIDATGALSIFLSDQNGGRADTARDVLSGTYMGTKFGKFEVYSATAQTVELFISDTTGGTKRQPGNVRVIDNGTEKTAAGKQYFGSMTQAAQAGSVSGLWVKPDAAQRISIKKIGLQSPVAGDVMLGIGVGDGTMITAPSVAAGIRNKLINGPLSAGQRGAAYCAGATPTVAEAPGWNTYARIYLPANQLIEVPLSTPIVLEGTARLYCLGLVVNRDVSMLLDAEE